MTATDQTPHVCPQCGNRNTTVGASGNAMCLDCAAMWDPDGPVAPVVPILAPFGVPPVDDVFGPVVHPSSGVTLPELADHVGGRVVLEGGQEAFLVAVNEDETVEVILPDDRTEVVGLESVHAMYMPPATPEIHDDDDALDGLAPDMRAALEIAKLIIRAGVESVNGTGETITPGVPPAGYLPDDPAMFSVVERAAALAVGMILELVDADVDAVLLAVGAVNEEVTEGDPTTEETDHGNGTDTDEW